MNTRLEQIIDAKICTTHRELLTTEGSDSAREYQLTHEPILTLEEAEYLRNGRDFCRGLLKKYIRHVDSEEGTAFIRMKSRMVEDGFTEEEAIELIELEDEGYPRGHPEE